MYKYIYVCALKLTVQEAIQELSTRDLEVPGSSRGNATFSTGNFLGQGFHSHFSGQLNLNRVPASAGVRAGMVASVGWQVTLCDPIGMRVPVAVRCLH